MTQEGTMMELAKELGTARYGLVGSQYILGSGHDVDMLFLVTSYHEARDCLLNLGFEADSEEYGGVQEFMSYKQTSGGFVWNALVTADEDFFCGFLTAAEVCKHLANYPTDVRQRSCRVALHKIIRDGCDWDKAGIA